MGTFRTPLSHDHGALLDCSKNRETSPVELRFDLLAPNVPGFIDNLNEQGYLTQPWLTSWVSAYDNSSGLTSLRFYLKNVSGEYDLGPTGGGSLWIRCTERNGTPVNLAIPICVWSASRKSLNSWRLIVGCIPRPTGGWAAGRLAATPHLTRRGQPARVSGMEAAKVSGTRIRRGAWKQGQKMLMSQP
ncbi:MAG: hypothetical protein WDA16_13180 [Candidatus Thermoplasmatota archaeon]